MLFIGAGAFHVSKPSDLIPELQGRFPIRVELENLTKEALRQILTVPKNALITQHKMMLETEGVKIDFTDEAVDEIAEIAYMTNEQNENIGARRLHTIMEKLLEDISFDLPNPDVKEIVIDKAYVMEKFADKLSEDDLRPVYPVRYPCGKLPAVLHSVTFLSESGTETAFLHENRHKIPPDLHNMADRGFLSL